MAQQLTFDEFKAGKIAALKVLEEYFGERIDKGLVYTTLRKEYDMIRTLRLNLEGKK